MPLTIGYVKYGAKPFVYKKIDKMKNKKTVSELQALDMLIAFLLSVAAVYLHTDSPFIYFNF